MAKFESPEINVVLFSEEEVITTSSEGGYEGSKNEGSYEGWSYNSITGGADGDFPL